MGRAMRSKTVPTKGRAVSAVAAASKTRPALPGKKNQENISRYFSKENNKLLQKFEEKHKMRRNVLTDKTNDVVPLRRLSLRRRSNLSGASASPGDASSGASCSGRVLGCPMKTQSTDKRLAAEPPHHVEEGPQKTCVYKHATVAACETKPLQDMSLDEKLKLYEFQVDKNEPKRVKKTRKRKIRFKRKVVTTDSSDDSCSMGQVVKRLPRLSTRKQITSVLTNMLANTPAATNSPFLFLPKRATDNLNTSVTKRMTDSVDTSVAKCMTDSVDTSVTKRMTDSVDTSVTKCMTDSVDTSVTKLAHFATNSGATNSTPQLIDHHVNKLRSRYREIMSSPDSSPIATCGTDDSCSGDVDMPEHLDIGHQPHSQGQLQQGNMQSILTPIQKNLNACSKAATVSRCAPASENASVRCSVSSLEPRNISLDLPAELNVSNCFGFDDAEDVDLEPVTRQNKSRIAIPRQRRPPAPAPLPPSVSLPSIVLESCTPSTADDAPTSLLFSDSKDLGPVSFTDDAEPTHFSKPARRSYDRPVRVHRNDSCNRSKYLEEQEEEVIVKKPRKKVKEYSKTEKKVVADWQAHMNAAFEEIEDVKLCVE